MLAQPYGYPKVMSSYAIRDGDHGPPRDEAGTPTTPPPGSDGCGEGWVCEHRWPAFRGMVTFRNATDGEAVVDWWDNENDQISFGRGERGFVVINREEQYSVTRDSAPSKPGTSGPVKK